MYKPLKNIPYHIQEPNLLRDMLQEGSVPELIDKLCVKFTQGLNENSSIKRKKYVKKLKMLAFQVLLMRSTSNIDKECDALDQDGLIATFVDKVYANELQSSTWTKKKTDELQRVVDRISDVLIKRPSLGCVIRFLLSLSDLDGISSPKISLDAINYHQFESHIRSLHSLPVLTSCTGYESSRVHIDHQPSVFDVRMMVDSPFSYSNNFYKITDIKDYPFDFEPGSGLKLFEEFTSLWPSKNKGYNRFSREFSDYSGMKPLSIPELNLEVPRSLTIPSLRSSHLDEGYVTPDKEFVDDDKRSSIKSTSDVWNDLNTSSLIEPVRYTWESLGKAESKKEPPFLLQSDRDVIECWKRHGQMLKNCNSHNAFVESVGNTSCYSDEEGLPDEFITISFKEFFRDVKCLLISVNSGTFFFDEAMNTFVIKPGISVPGVTPDGLEVYSKDLIECGNNFRSLNMLVKRNNFCIRSAVFDSNVTNSTLSTSISNVSSGTEGATVHRGLVFEALCTSICCWLQAYRGVVIKMVSQDSDSLLDIKLWLHPLQQQLQFLVNLCCPPTPDFKLPTGGALLTHIYNVVEVTISKPFSYIVFHILEKCCKVYFRFLENWLFEGICDDVYGEFFIEQRSSYENIQDRSYWRKAFFLRPERVPVFLSNLVNDIFVCGKTLNLVKFCNPSDPLCIRLENVYPRMSPCFEENSLDKLATEYNQFVLSCKNACAAVPLMKVLSLGIDTDEVRENHLKVVSQQRTESLQRIKNAQQEQRRKEDEKKRQLFVVMKNDMLEAEKRKKEDRQKTIEEDQKRLDELAQAALIEESKKEEEKQKVIQYYKSLNAAADNRKLRAEWKIKRLELNEKRIDFLAEEKECFKGELLTNKLLSLTKVDKECDNLNHSSVNSKNNIHSVSSYGSWMTCPTISTENGLQVNGLAVDNESNIVNSRNVTKSKEAVGNVNDCVKSGSFDSLLDVRDVKSNKLGSTKSSSDTDLYVSSTNCNLNQDDAFNNHLKNDDNHLNAKADKINQIDDVLLKNKSDEGIVSEGISLPSKLENNISNNNDFNNIGSLLNSAGIDKSKSVKQLMPPKLLTDQITISSRHGSETELTEITYNSVCNSNEKQVLHKMFSDTRNAALLNKHKVLESEYGININKSEVVKEEVDIGSSKDKVLEMKTKMNESAIKQRTEQLALAKSNFIESRRAAARNKEKVMSSEYSVFMHKSVKESKEKINENVINKFINAPIEEKPKDNQSTQSVFKDNAHEQINSSEGSDTKSDKIAKKSYIMSSEYVDSDGRFTMDSKPMIVDIADKIIPQKSESLLIDENTNYITMHYCLHKSVSIPTEIQKTFTNDAILRLFILNEKLIDHLQCIRSHFFLLDGEYGRTLTRSLFTDLENVEQPSALLTYLRLNSILRSAIRSLHNESPFVERLSFFVKDIPLVFVLTDSEVLNCLSMRYRVHWPLNIILTEEAIINYDRIFAFQLKIQRAVWALEQDMHLLKMRSMMRSSHYRQLQIFRHTMTQFVRAISNYITRIALEESWVEFKNNLSKADTLDALYSAHVDYIKMTLFRCLLNKRSETIHKTIMGLLRNILTFHELLRTGEWVYDLQTGDHVHSAFSRLFNQYSSFVRTLRYLIKFLTQVICYGYQPHLDVLITFLSGNDFYLMDV